MSDQTLCRYFNTAGGCRNGSSCRFTHDASIPTAPPGACWLYWVSRRCLDRNCSLTHVERPYVPRRGDPEIRRLLTAPKTPLFHIPFRGMPGGFDNYTLPGFQTPPPASEQDCFLSFCILTDTHLTPFAELEHFLPPCDVLLFCGDFIDWVEVALQVKGEMGMKRGMPVDDDLHPTKYYLWKEFDAWVGRIQESGLAKRVIAIEGNHDYVSDPAATLSNAVFFRNCGKHVIDPAEFGKLSNVLPRVNVYSIVDANVEDRPRKDHRRLYRDIPDDTHVLVTHYPPGGILDGCVALGSEARDPSEACGLCGRAHGSRKHSFHAELREKVFDLILNHDLRIHAFGHRHSGPGMWVHPPTGAALVKASCTWRKVLEKAERKRASRFRGQDSRSREFVRRVRVFPPIPGVVWVRVGRHEG